MGTMITRLGLLAMLECCADNYPVHLDHRVQSQPSPYTTTELNISAMSMEFQFRRS